ALIKEKTPIKEKTQKKIPSSFAEQPTLKRDLKLPPGSKIEEELEAMQIRPTKPISTEKMKLLEICEKSKITPREIRAVLKKINNEIGLLFCLNKKGDNFFTLVKNKCDQEVLVPLIAHTIMHADQIFASERAPFLDSLFIRDVDSGYSLFE